MKAIFEAHHKLLKVATMRSESMSAVQGRRSGAQDTLKDYENICSELSCVWVKNKGNAETRKLW